MNAETSLATKLKLLHQYTQAVVRGEQRGFLLVGDPGLGKSFNVPQCVDPEITEYAPSHNSPLGFYDFVHSNSTKLIIIDDSANGFRDAKIQAFIKAMLWANPVTKKYTVAWRSTSSALESRGLPEEFDFEGKLIFIANEIPNNVHARAIESRMLTYRFDLTFEERKVLLSIVAERNGFDPLTKDQIQEIVTFLNQRANPSCRNFDLRLLSKAAGLFKQFPGDWELAVGNLIEADPRFDLMSDLVKSGMSVKEQMEAFEQKTGLKRRQFFKLRDRWGMKLH
jgi:hypothetical protein